MLTERKIRRAGCGWGSAEKWLTGDVRTGTGGARAKERAPPAPAEQGNVPGLYGSCIPMCIFIAEHARSKPF